VVYSLGPRLTEHPPISVQELRLCLNAGQLSSGLKTGQRGTENHLSQLNVRPTRAIFFEKSSLRRISDLGFQYSRRTVADYLWRGESREKKGLDFLAGPQKAGRWAADLQRPTGGWPANYGVADPETWKRPGLGWFVVDGL